MHQLSCVTASCNNWSDVCGKHFLSPNDASASDQAKVLTLQIKSLKFSKANSKKPVGCPCKSINKLIFSYHQRESVQKVRYFHNLRYKSISQGSSIKQTALSGLTALTSVVQRNAKLSKFANDFAKISDGFDNYENSRSLSWPGRLVKPGEEGDGQKGDHLFLSDRAIFARIVQVIEDSGEVAGDEKQRAERRVGEQQLQTEGFSSYEVEAGVDEQEHLVDRTAEPPVGSLTCWARYAVCLTR